MGSGGEDIMSSILQPLEKALSAASGLQKPLSHITPQLHRRSRRKHMAAASMASLLAMCLIAVLIFHGYVAWMLAYPYVAPLESNPAQQLGLPYEDVVFPSKSGETTVSGWFIPADAPQGSAEDAVATRTVVFSHGYGANREESWVPMYDLAELMHDLDYNVLMFDYGYASTAYKAPATGGREESQQLLAAVDYAQSRGAEDIIVWGFSMGAGTALQSALVTDKIDAMILDSLFVPSPEALFDNLNQFVPLPRFPSLPLIRSMIPLWTGSSFGSIPVSEVASHAYNIPIFIIHGTNDSKAPYAVAESIAANQRNSLSRSWIVQNGQHEMLFRMGSMEYIQRTALFLSQVNAQLHDG